KFLRDNASHSILMLRRQVAIEKTDGDRFNAGFAELTDRCTDRVRIERRADLACREDALGYFAPVSPAYQRQWLINLQIVEIWPPLSPDLKEVSESLGRDHTGRNAFAFEQRIRGDG